MELYHIIAILSVLIFISACSSKLSSWINMPCLLVFLGVGLLAGSEGIGRIHFENASVANGVGSVAMAFILYSGGFDTKWKTVKRVLDRAGILSSIGVFLTAVFVGIFTYAMLWLCVPERGASLSWCLLLGAVISSTDAAAVFSILRSRSVGLKGQLKPLLELESGSNDPMAAFLTVFMLGLVQGTGGMASGMEKYLMIIPGVLLEMSVGIGVGLGCGLFFVWLFNKIDFEHDGLYYVVAVAAVLFSFSFAMLLHGNGFMAVYVAGMVMGNKGFVYHNGIGRFHDGVAWLMQVVLFTMLGLLAFPKQLWDAKWVGLAVAFFLMFVARPLTVYICMLGSRFTRAEKLLVSWVGLRGGAPIMLATFPMMAGIENADLMFHIVFFIVLTSVFIQGMTLMPYARYLKLDSPVKESPRVPLQFEQTGSSSETGTEFEIPEEYAGEERPLASLKLPKGALVVLIRRGAKFIVPQGDTKIAAGDVLMMMGNQNILRKTGEMLKDEFAGPVDDVIV